MFISESPGRSLDDLISDVKLFEESTKNACNFKLFLTKSMKPHVVLDITNNFVFNNPG